MLGAEGSSRAEHREESKRTRESGAEAGPGAEMEADERAALDQLLGEYSLV